MTNSWPVNYYEIGNVRVRNQQVCMMLLFFGICLQWLKIQCHLPVRGVYVTVGISIHFNGVVTTWAIWFHLPPVFDTATNSQHIWIITTSPNLLCQEKDITWLIQPTFLSTGWLDVEGNIRRQVSGASVTGWEWVHMVNPGDFVLPPQETCNRKLGASCNDRLSSPYKQPTFTGLKNSSSRSCIIIRFQDDHFLLRVFHSTIAIIFLRQPSDITLY
jgi:hypothetical protein